jgi:nitroreductase
MARSSGDDAGRGSGSGSADRYVSPERYDQLLDVLKHRRAVRGYRDVPVEEEKLENVLEAGRWAPSGANTQPWEFVVVTDPETTDAIADAYIDFFHERYGPSDPSFPDDNTFWMRSAPAYIVPLGDTRVPSRSYPQVDGEAQLNEEVFQHSLANAIFSMWLAAATLGLGSTSASCFTPVQRAIRAILDVPDVFAIPATMPIGYPLKYQSTRYRKPLADLVHYGTYDRDRFVETEELDRQVEQIRRSRFRGDGKLIPRDRLGIDEDGHEKGADPAGRDGANGGEGR